jgi:hypothetical protein
MHVNVQRHDPEKQLIAAPAATHVHTAIDGVPFDVLVLVFQQLVEEESAQKRNWFPLNRSIHAPYICTQLALVNKRWKEAVVALRP